MSAPHHKKVPSRASLPRRTTRGPLDGDVDTLTATQLPNSPTSAQIAHSFVSRESETDVVVSPIIPEQQRSLLTEDVVAHDTSAVFDSPAAKDLSFLLDPAIYHAISQENIPAPFQKPLISPPPTNILLKALVVHIDDLCKNCDFVNAAHLAAVGLTRHVQPTDNISIFKLLTIRYSCLELLSQTTVAAQEAGALEDLSSDFYYTQVENNDAMVEARNGRRPIAKHIMPFELRIQAMRLQNIGFNDPRRTVTGLYELGLECRQQIASPYTSGEERGEWKERLENLMQLKPTAEAKQALWNANMVLLLAKMGKLERAYGHVKDMPDSTTKSLLGATVALADEQIKQAKSMLSSIEGEPNAEIAALVKQNLAVALLYQGKIEEAQKILEDMITAGGASSSLVLNLATIFDLTTDKVQGEKIGLTQELANRSQAHTSENAMSMIERHQKPNKMARRSKYHANMKDLVTRTNSIMPPRPPPLRPSRSIYGSPHDIQEALQDQPL
ncbi:hypothetical protein LTR66_013708 [Elasticomyces elasticus]|nr:hypothetical protein LTR66_013708 [Elasticomyces elasticus]